MSAIEPSPTPRRDPSAAIALRVGAVVAIALALSVEVNVFAGSVAFAILLAALAAFSAWGERATEAVTRLGSRRTAEDEPADMAELELATPPLPPSTAAGACASS